MTTWMYALWLAYLMGSGPVVHGVFILEGEHWQQHHFVRNHETLEECTRARERELLALYTGSGVVYEATDCVPFTWTITDAGQIEKAEFPTCLVEAPGQPPMLSHDCPDSGYTSWSSDSGFASWTTGDADDIGIRRGVELGTSLGTWPPGRLYLGDVPIGSWPR